MNLFSSMLWAAQGVDGTELDQAEQHEAKPNSANWEKDDFFSRMASLIWFIAQVHEWLNWHKGGSECEQLGTRMVGLTMLVTGQIYVRLKWQHSRSLRRTHIEKPGQKSTQCTKAAWKAAAQPEIIHLPENLMDVVPWLWNLLHIHIRLAEVQTRRCKDYV